MIRRGIAGRLLAVGLCFSAFFPAWSGIAAEKVVLAYPAPVSWQHSDFLFGKQLGFFEQEGIDLELVAFQGTPVVVPQVANKSVTFGIADSSYLISALDKNEPVPVRFVYNFVRAVSNDIAVMDNSPIKSLSDLKGKKLGVGSTSFITQTLTKAVLKEAGVSWNDIEVLPIGLGPAAWKQLETGKVDAVNFFRSEDSKMRLAGLKIRQLFYPEKFSKIFVASVIAHEDTIRDRPKLIEGMGRAMAKSSVACLANENACMRAFWTFDPTSKPLPGKEEEWVKNALPILDANYESVGYFHDNDRRWGVFPQNALGVYIEAMQANNIIKRSDIDQDKIYTNQFVKAFNDFSIPEVEAIAKNVKY